jgi:hypothetical protein
MGTIDGSGGETLNRPPRRLCHAAVEIWRNVTAKTDRSMSYIVDKAIRKILKLFAGGEDRQTTINEKTTNEDQARLETVVRWPGDKR